MSRLFFLPLQPQRDGNSNEFAWPQGIVELDGGRVGVLLNSFSESAAAVLRADGSPDPSFGVNGQAILSRDVQLVAGSVTPSGAVEFLGGVGNSPPISLQRSVGGSPWPPTAPAPKNLVVSFAVDRAGNPGFDATWSPVVNPDPEITEYRYQIGVARGSDAPYTFESDTASAQLFGLEPGRYTVSVRSVNIHTVGRAATATLVVPMPDLIGRPKGSNFSPAVRMLCTPAAHLPPGPPCKP